MIIEGNFKRKSPAAFAEKIGIPLGWFVVSWRYMPDQQERRHAHGHWYRITNGKYSVCRVLRFSPNLAGTPDDTGEIVIDWVGWLDLNGREEDVDAPLDLRISRVPFFEIPLMAIQHPDPSFRLAGWLALISLGLGLLSLALGFEIY